MKKSYLLIALFAAVIMMSISGCSKSFDSNEYKEYLADGGDPDVVLLTAIDECDTGMAEAAIKSGASINKFGPGISDDVGRTYSSDVPLRVALGRGSQAADIVELLIREGADVDYMDDEEYETNLMFCSRDADIALVNILLQNGASVDTVNKNGQTALSLAVSGETHDDEITEALMQLLLEHDAEVTTKAVENVFNGGYYAGCTQYRLAGILMRKAEEQGCLKKVNIDDHLKAAFTGNNDLLIPYLKGKKSFDEKEFRVVLACAASDDTEAVREYLKNNDIDHASRDGVTMLMAAASCGAGNVVDLLIEEGADLHKLDKYGNSAAVKAQEYGEYDIFEKIKNSEGKSR